MPGCTLNNLKLWIFSSIRMSVPQLLYCSNTSLQQHSVGCFVKQLCCASCWRLSTALHSLSVGGLQLSFWDGVSEKNPTLIYHIIMQLYRVQVVSACGCALNTYYMWLHNQVTVSEHTDQKQENFVGPRHWTRIGTHTKSTYFHTQNNQLLI